MRRLLLAVALGLSLIWGVILGLSSQTQAQSTQRLVTVLSSAGRITSTTSSDIVNIGENLNTRGAYIILSVSAITATPLITPIIQVKDPVSGNYEGVMTATTGVSAVGTHTYLVYPGAGAAAGDVVQVVGYPLPPVWRVIVTHGDTDAITYTVGAMLVQ